MLSRTEAADLPDIQAEHDQQARLAALGLTISQFQKTLPGRGMVERQELFVLGGMLYQGYNQKAVEVPEDQCTDAELQRTHDIDGTLQRVLDTRRRRLEGTKNAKDRELGERRKLKIAQERDELELRMLKRQAAAAGLDPDVPDDPDDPDPPQAATSTVFACGCGKTFADARALNAHKMGSKH